MMTVTLKAPENWAEIRDLMDESHLTTHEALWVARQILGAAMSVVKDPGLRESFLRAYVVGVLQDVADHEARRPADRKL
jgi:hypothetical protein